MMEPEELDRWLHIKRESYTHLMTRARDLERQATVMSEAMAKLAKDIKRNPKLRVNELGELQSRGAALDVACGRHHEALRAYEMLTQFIEKNS